VFAVCCARARVKRVPTQCTVLLSQCGARILASGKVFEFLRGRMTTSSPPAPPPSSPSALPLPLLTVLLPLPTRPIELPLPSPLPSLLPSLPLALPPP